MKTVTIGGTGWTESYPQRARGDIVRMVFSLASHKHHEVNVHGQHWPGSSKASAQRPTSSAPAMTQERWAMIMNIRPGTICEHCNYELHICASCQVAIGHDGYDDHQCIPLTTLARHLP